MKSQTLGKLSTKVIEGRGELGSTDVAPPNPMPEAPNSLLSKTSTVLSEREALKLVTFESLNLPELEERIGLAARIVIEHYLRSSGLAPKDKCDIALRAISTLEGSRQEVTWRDERMKKPATSSLVALKAEKEKIASQLIDAALRKKEVKLVEAEKALKELEAKSKESTSDEPKAKDLN